MPIRPENRARYPKNWRTEIVPRIRARSGNRCECTGQCGDRHVGSMTGRCTAINGQIGHFNSMGYFSSRKPPDGVSEVKIVLTVMHLNHTPEDCDDANLLHGCQRCHNRYDAPVRAAGIKARKRAARASGDLFQCEETP